MDPSITSGAGRGIGHEGDLDGYHTSAFYFPEKATAVVAIADSDDDSQYTIMTAALEALFATSATASR
jgi:hypothetical protein